MRRSPALALLLAVLLPLAGAPVPAEDPPGAAPPETVRVQLAQFDVVVRDKKGRIVSGLTRDDFEVLEDGRVLDIEAVDAWGEAPPAPVPGSTPPSSSAEPATPSP